MLVDWKDTDQECVYSEQPLVRLGSNIKLLFFEVGHFQIVSACVLLSDQSPHPRLRDCTFGGTNNASGASKEC